MSEKILIQVPATTANLGSGFDVLGVALNLYNFISIEKAYSNTINVSDNSFYKNIEFDKDNLIHKSIRRVHQELDLRPDCLKIDLEVNIPLSRGMGSSSSAIIGGLVAGNELTGNQLSLNELLDLANEIEGHPDNVAPCLLGGIVMSLCEDKNVYTQTIKTKLDLDFIITIPDFMLSTEKARKALPSQIPFSDAVFNLSRLAFLIQSFNDNNIEYLKHSFKDRLHEQYRGKLITGFEEVKETALKNGAIGAVLSGAGPSILAISNKNSEQVAKAMQQKWSEFGINSSYRILKIENSGAKKIS